jgi:hypothetical protein
VRGTSTLSCCALSIGVRRLFAASFRARVGLWAALSLVPFCSLAAHAGSPAVTLSPNSLTFGTQLRGTTSPAQTITLTNTGTASLSITAIRASAYYSETNNCQASLAAGASCTISVSFSPAANGTITGTIAVADNATGSPQDVSLSGTCTVASLTPASLSFVNQSVGTTSPAQVLTLSNVGANAVHVSAITIQGANPSDFSQTNSCTTISSGSSCPINITFTPAAVGTFTGTVNVTFTGSVSPIPATLTGTGSIRTAPVPYLNEPLAPPSAPPGGSGSTLTLNGSGFVSGSSVLFNGSSRATTFVSHTQLQAALTSSDVATAGTAQVVVTNPSPGGGASNPQAFQITNPTSTVLMGGNTLAVGTDPRGTVTAEFNGDGIPDVAVVDRGTNSVTILMGNGDGTFAAAANYATGVDPIALAVGDFNGDGIPDLVTANRAAYTISILLGNGDGTFGSHLDYPTGTEPMAVAVGDFNGDGNLDIAVVNNADNTVSIYLGVGNGTFQNPVTYSVGASPIAIVTGNFNGDGNLDLAVADAGANNVGVLLGNGDGTFQNAVFYATDSDPSGLFSADFNGDGKLDLVTANNGGDDISVLLNSGTGTFAAGVNYPVGTLPFAISGGDFYGNGIMDLAVVNSGDNTVSIVPGNGDGTFSTSGALTFGVGNQALGIAVADFNLDGRADLVVSNSADNTVSVLLQVPSVTFSTPSLAYGTEGVGSFSPPQTVVLTNSGSAALAISGIAVAGLNPQFVQSNNCPSSLAAGSTCMVNVRFEPTAAGVAEGSLTITDGASGSPQAVSLLGEGVQPTVVLSPTSLTFSTQAVGTTSAAQAVNLTNTGSEALTLTSITASTGYAQTNTCGSSVAAGGACSITVTFTPTATGTQAGTITIVDNAGSSQFVGLTGTGSGAPGASLSPTTLTFSSQTVDTMSAAQTATLTNNGIGPLTITSVTTTGNYSQTNTCGTSLTAGANCTISVFFTPTAAGTLHGSVVVTDSATSSPQSLTTTGTGSISTVAFAPADLSFVNQVVHTSSAKKSIKLTNNTGAAVTISKMTISANYSETNTCGTGLAVGASCTIGVIFTPTVSGILSGTLTVTDNAGSDLQTVPLSGTGIAASVAFTPAGLTFADQTVGTTSPASVVTLSNTGTAALTINNVAITGANSGDYAQSNTCGGSVAVGASCSISTTFTPAAAGIRTASISVGDSATGSPQSVPLTGTGIAPTVAFSPASITFANQAVGTSSTANVITLSNPGNATLTITSITVTGTNSGDFTETNTCGTSLAPGTGCAISVTFTPIAPGTRQASISVVDSAAGSPQTASLSGVGTAPSVTFSSSSLVFASTAVGTTSPASGVTLFNMGNATLSISSITITGANAGDFSQTNTCDGAVTAASNCAISVSFTPSAAGTRTAAVLITDNAAGSPQSVSLSGTGTTGGPAASVSPLSLTFGSQNVLTTSPAQTVTLTNNGKAALSLTSIVAAGDFAQTNNCGASLAAAASCSVQVTFSPSATGTRGGYITFTDNAPSIQQTVTLTGTGAAPNTTVSILPGQASVTPGQSMQFQASISGVASSKVTWAVDGVTGGNSTTGTISSSGLYTGASSAGSHIVTATSTANTTQSASVPVVVTSYAGTLVYHNDNGRTGQNLTETVLTTGNVNVNQFGKLFTYPVDGQMYAEPLYVQGVTVAGLGVHNVVYAATQNDSVYAFDADGTTPSPLWQVSLIPAGGQVLLDSDIGGCSNISPQVGITGTPVIDPTTNTMFVVARSKIVNGAGTTYYQYLHALDITTGLDRPGSPVNIQATVTGDNGPVAFNTEMQNQRAGLFLDNGVVYIAWGSHCDILPYNGWLMGYQESTLQQTAVFLSAPNGQQDGIWQSGAAPAVDEYGYIYAMIGNGTTDVNVGGIDYGEALIKFNSSNLSVADYFLPSNFANLNDSDLDLGSGGPLLIPDQPNPPTQMLVAAGKQGMVYLVNRDDLGQYSPNGNNVLQVLPAGTVPTAHSMPAFWENNVYFVGVGNPVQSFLLSNALLSTSPTSQSSVTFAYPGATPVVSANGSTDGILWVLSTVKGYAAILYAYDAANLSHALYNSDQNEPRDEAGISAKFAVPTVANGKVYVGTSVELDVYGLLPQP